MQHVAKTRHDATGTMRGEGAARDKDAARRKVATHSEGAAHDGGADRGARWSANEKKKRK